jgi:hypothetical protein
MESFPNYTLIMDYHGKHLTTLNHHVTHYSLIKTPSEPLAGFLTDKQIILMCNSDTNFTRCTETRLASTLPS